MPGPRVAIADIAPFESTHTILVSIPKGQSRTGKDAENGKKDDQRSGIDSTHDTCLHFSVWRRRNRDTATVHKILSGLERIGKEQQLTSSSNTKTRETTRGTIQNSRMKIQDQSKWLAFKWQTDYQGKCLSGSTKDAKNVHVSTGKTNHLLDKKSRKNH